MSAYAALVNREFLEHRSAFLWAAGIVLTLIVLAGLMVLRADVMMGDMSDADRIELIEKLGDDAQDVGGLETLVAMGLDVAGSTDAELGGKMHMFMAIIATPFHWLLSLILARGARRRTRRFHNNANVVALWRELCRRGFCAAAAG